MGAEEGGLAVVEVEEDGCDAGEQQRSLAMYAALGALSALLACSQAVVLTPCALKASREMHARLLCAMLAAPMAFFDATSAGSILNRFLQDMASVDNFVIAPSVWTPFIEGERERERERERREGGREGEGERGRERQREREGEMASVDNFVIASPVWTPFTHTNARARAHTHTHTQKEREREREREMASVDNFAIAPPI